MCCGLISCEFVHQISSKDWEEGYNYSARWRFAYQFIGFLLLTRIWAAREKDEKVSVLQCPMQGPSTILYRTLIQGRFLNSSSKLEIHYQVCGQLVGLQRLVVGRGHSHDLIKRPDFQAPSCAIGVSIRSWFWQQRREWLWIGEFQREVKCQPGKNQ